MLAGPGLALVVALTQAPPLLPPRVDRLAWLQGCWETESNGRLLEAQWLSARGASMLGVGRTTRGTKLVEYELVLIRERGDHLSYEAHPSREEPALFMSTVIAARSIVFENLKQDFPQRVGYERTSAERLVAWVEGVQDGRTRHAELSYRRVPCAGD